MSNLFSHTLHIDQATDPGSGPDGPEGEEERIVAELQLLGIQYLTRRTSNQAERVRSPDILLADLVRQPSARVRAAVIAVLLAHPEYADGVTGALKRLHPSERRTLRFFYTAAALLQREHAEKLPSAASGKWLPNRFADELALPTSATIKEQLVALGQRHRQQTHTYINWLGTYENVVHHLLRSWELEARWSQ